jgi:uncharacterized protein with ATP-grasp and redox domains
MVPPGNRRREKQYIGIEDLMHSYIDCVSCTLKTAADAVKQAGLKEDRQNEVMKKILQSLSRMDLNLGSAQMTHRIFRVIREVGGIHDPLKNTKSYSLDLAIRAYPELKQTLDESKDRFATAVRIALAGNIIDHDHHDREDNLALFKSVEDALSRPLVVNHMDFLKAEVKKAKSILYLADNAGETVFDRILIEELPMDRITYAVRGTPVGNNATMRDATLAGLTEIVNVVEDGSDYPCVFLKKCSRAFKRTFDRADLIISKGQDNFQTLMNVDRNIFFLVRIRCKVKATECGLSVGDFLVKGRKL